MTKINKHNTIRDFLVYSISSLKYYSKAGKLTGSIIDLFNFRRWHQFRNSKEGTLHFQTPWLVFTCIDYLKQWLDKKMIVFEYGSGGSTLFFANHVAKIYSVEHDGDWYHITRSAIEDLSIQNVEYYLIPPEADENYITKNCLNPKDNISCRNDFKGKSFNSYIESIDKFQDASFDLVIIDGRARQSCIGHAISKIKPGGILLLDNADRQYYLEPYPQFKDNSKWKRLEFIGHFPFAPASVLSKTFLFVKL